MESNEGVTENKTSAPYGVAAIDLSWLFTSNEERPLVAIKCGIQPKSETFTVLKPILTKNSKFFEKCLRNPCKESESLTVELPDVKPSMMMLYLTLATRQALLNCTSADSLVKREDFAVANRISEHARFYQLCDFLQNEELAKSTHKMLVDIIKIQRKLHNESRCPSIFRAYASTFCLLEQGNVIQAKLRRTLVKSFCCCVNASNFFKHCDILKNYPDFLLEVAKQYALNSMWNDPVHEEQAENIKTQRMLVDDESEPDE